MPTIQGTVADGFEPVRDAFVENFEAGAELGAACAVYHRGACVVDLWGGHRDLAGEDPWTADTMVQVFSATKGMTAAAIAVALSRGLFALDDRIADHWPAFARHGKGDVTVRQLLSHQAGLATLDRRLSPADIADADRLAAVLADQHLDWTPGTEQGYHAYTLGWYASELVRRTDGRTVGAFFADEVAPSLDLDFHIGLPAGADEDRVAELATFSALDMLRNLDSMPWRFTLAFLYPRSLTHRAVRVLDGPMDAVSTPAFRRVEIPSATGVGTVRSIAATYGDLATGGDRLGVDAAVLAELESLPTPPVDGWRDAVIKIRTAYSTGCSKPLGDFQFGSSSTAYGAPGAGGAFGFADPDRELGYAYAPNRLGLHQADDPRERALRDAVYQCLDQRQPTVV